MEDKFRFSEMLSALSRAKVDMPKLIAEGGQRYFQLNYRKRQNPDGVKWKPKKRDNGKPIGVNSGNLESKMNDTIITYDYKRIIWGIKDVYYAGYFSYGTDIMPARGTIEDGKEIRGKIKGIIKRQFDKVVLKK